MSRKTILFLALTLLLSGLYFVYAYFTLPPTPEAHGMLAQLGEGMGTAAGWGLGLLYCRGPLKLLLKDGPLWQRLVPSEVGTPAWGLGEVLLRLLNRTHGWLGILTVVLIAGHAAFSGRERINPFLLLTLGVVFWQGGFGLFLRSPILPRKLRRPTYGVHAQLVTGILILIFAGFGHLLVGG